jgi:hypothetical protein
MSHWAEINENNIVVRVIVGDNDDPNGDEGYQWIVDNLGGNWIQTSYNGTIRKNYAGIGYTYDLNLDAFYAPQPYPSWVLNEDARWQAPVAYPTDGKSYFWDETTLQWVEVPDTIETNQPDEADLIEGTN